MDCSMSGFPVLHYFLEFAQTHVCCVNDAISPSNLILCCPLLLPSIFPSIRIFPNELALRIRWPKYWSLSFSFIISPSKEYSGLISFRIDWFYLLAVQGTLKSLLRKMSFGDRKHKKLPSKSCLFSVHWTFLSTCLLFSICWAFIIIIITIKIDYVSSNLQDLKVVKEKFYVPPACVTID